MVSGVYNAKHRADTDGRTLSCFGGPCRGIGSAVSRRGQPATTPTSGIRACCSGVRMAFIIWCTLSMPCLYPLLSLT